MQAIDFYLERHPAGLKMRTVQQVVDELIETKRRASKSDVHLKDLESRLGKFAKAFACPISSVTQDLIQQWVDELKLSNRTKVNYLRLVRLLFGFATKKKYLPREALFEIKDVEKPEAEETEIEIFAPDELRELFRHARPEMIPWLAISAFGGVRNAELSRLDWRNVNLKSRFIEVSGGKAKTGTRRLVPICDALFAWLQPHAKPSGPVVEFANVAKQIGWLVDDVNEARAGAGQPEFVWKHNGLRHSFCSYRLAVVQDAAQVALEAGNSPSMLFRHYRELVTKEQGLEWFGIVPAPETNIVPMAMEAKATEVAS
jgi:integrase